MNHRVILALCIFPAPIYCMERTADLTINDFEPLIYQEVIQENIDKKAEEISRDHEGKSLTIVMVMKGAIHLVSDLMRSKNLKVPVTLECIQASSYGQNGTEPGTLNLFGADRLNLKDKHVLLVDDILDTGETLSGIIKQLSKQMPASLKTCVLLQKSKKRKNLEHADYPIFTISDAFVIGYGLDYKEQFRNLHGIWIKKGK